MHACTSGPVTARHLNGLSPMARRRRKSLHARALCCCRVADLARMLSSARLGFRSRRFGAGRKPTWTAASSACSRIGARGPAIVTRTAKEKPKHATHWSARMLAEEIGVGHTTVQRVWKEHGLKPHLSRPFKLSNDPKFAEKAVDMVGLYLNPP